MSEVDVFLDVDGVLNAVHVQTPPGWGWPDEETCIVNGCPIRYSPTLIGRINTLAAQPNVQMHWLTTWEHDAQTILSPALGIDGADWPVVGTEEHYSKELAISGGWWKWHALRDLIVADEPDCVIWIDDDISYDRAALDWLRGRDDVLWIAPKTHKGITPADMDRIEEAARPAPGRIRQPLHRPEETTHG